MSDPNPAAEPRTTDGHTPSPALEAAPWSPAPQHPYSQAALPQPYVSQPYMQQAPAAPYAAQQYRYQQYPGQPPQPGQPYAYPAGYPAAGYAPARPTNGVALAAMICGIAGIVLSPITFFLFVTGLISVAAIVLGHVGLSQLKRRPELGGKGMAITGLILGYVPIALGILSVVIMVVSTLLLGMAAIPFFTS